MQVFNNSVEPLMVKSLGISQSFKQDEGASILFVSISNNKTIIKIYFKIKI